MGAKKVSPSFSVLFMKMVCSFNIYSVKNLIKELMLIAENTLMTNTRFGSLSDLRKYALIMLLW